MAIASTGRLSSTDPNLQNIPIRTEEGSRIRRAFIAEPGHVLVSADYSQIELRLLAHVADIPALRDSFARGEDIHARTASEVFGVPMAGMDPMTRRRAKAINFGIIYGISAFGLGRQLGIAPGEARGYIDAYFARYPGIRAYMETHQGGGAHRRLRHDAVRPPLLDHRASPTRTRRGAATPSGRRSTRRCRAAPRTSSSARWCACRRRCAMPGCTARMLLQVHDELLFEAPEDEADALARLAQQVMEGGASWPCRSWWKQGRDAHGPTRTKRVRFAGTGKPVIARSAATEATQGNRSGA